MKKNDEYYMSIAIELAKKAVGHTTPNPLVGCVVVKNDKIISTGWHKKAGLPHAEAMALNKIGKKASGAVLYVTLEPCCHFGKTPPCTDAIIRNKVKKVVSAMADPNPKVNGCGHKRLKQAGIEVVSGVLEKEAKELNRFFIKNITKKMPYIIMKAGISLDGKMALSNGVSQWITGSQARAYDQQLRQATDAIAVGIGTIITDNPFLDCRIDKTKKIKKVIFDTHGRTPLNANIFKHSKPEDIYIFVNKMNKTKINSLTKLGVNVIIQNTTDVIDVKKAVSALYNKGICSIVVEGGGLLHTSFMKERLYDEARLYIAPIFIGNDGLAVTRELGLKNLENPPQLTDVEVVRLGRDTLIKGDFKNV